jgi:hypothetical protein
MNVPKYIYEALAAKFSAADTETIDKNWFTYSNGFSFGNSSNAQIMREARMVLACVKYEASEGSK